MNIRKKFSSQFLVIGMFGVFMVFSLATGFVFQVTKAKQYKSEIVSINKKIEDTKLEINNIRKLEETKDLETEVRTRLNMVKPNEIIYVDIKEGN